MTNATITVTTEVELSVDVAAKWFCGLNDEAQADFFVAVQRESMSWEGLPEGQWWYVMRHLQTCECSNEATRQMIRYWGEVLASEPA